MQRNLSMYSLLIHLVCIDHNGKKYYLADINIPDKGDFILLESLIHEKNTSRIISLIIPSPEKKLYKLGREKDSDVRITDVSVSRFHAMLRYTNNGFFIEDNASKFGTLALIKNWELEEKVTAMFQVGRTMAQFILKPIEQEEAKGK